MPRPKKTEEEKEKKTKTSTKKTSTSKKTTEKKVVTKKVTTKKAVSKKATTKTVKKEKETKPKTTKAVKKTTKKTAEKKEPIKKTASKKEKVVKEPKKKITTKKKTEVKPKSTTKKKVEIKEESKKEIKKKSTTKRTITKKKVVRKKVDKPQIEIIEYYDLPYRYNETLVKVLAQTPNTLFIYWDISDKDRKNLEENYGESFFNDTKPILIIENTTMNYSFELDIDDFANSWYLHIEDSNCDYKITLARRKKYLENNPINLENNFLYLTSSNNIEVPNDHVLFDKNLTTVYFRDVKTNLITPLDITSISFLRNMGHIYNILNLKENKENLIDGIRKLDLNNPSSGNPTSTFK